MSFVSEIKKYLFKKNDTNKIHPIKQRGELFALTLLSLNKNNIFLESDIYAEPSQKFNPIDEIEELLFLLSESEQGYYYLNGFTPVFAKTYLTALILSQARDAIDLLNEVNVKNKKISYYENKKNASLDDFIELCLKKLSAENEHKISLPIARREVEIKLLIAWLKKKHPEYIHFYVLLFSDVMHGSIATWYDDETIKDVMEDFLQFFGIGHATPDMIYKSTALQIFGLFKDTIEIKELKEIINKLIYYTFKKDYKNFSGFGDKSIFLKNVVEKFPIYDINDDKKVKKQRRIRRLFVRDFQNLCPEMRHPKMIPTFDIMVNHPLDYRLLDMHLKYFG